MNPLSEPLRVVAADVIRDIVSEKAVELSRIVAETYLLHADGSTVNPASQFLRFPDRPDARIIALPAALCGSSRVAGIKWIASFPSNTGVGIPRASAVLVLNSMENGYPFALLESSIISATRTAMSAVIAARCICKSKQIRTVAFVGNGLIAKHIFDTFLVQCAALFRTYPPVAAKAALARVTLAKMSLALAVQMNGLGSML